MDAAEIYWQRAENAGRAAETARDAEAKRLMREAAQRWRQLAEFAQRQEMEAPHSDRAKDSGQS